MGLNKDFKVKNSLCVSESLNVTQSACVGGDTSIYGNLSVYGDETALKQGFKPLDTIQPMKEIYGYDNNQAHEVLNNFLQR